MSLNFSLLLTLSCRFLNFWLVVIQLFSSNCVLAFHLLVPTFAAILLFADSNLISPLCIYSVILEVLSSSSIYIR